MSKVIADISMSLDGYVTAPGAGLEHGLGIGGEPIRAWVLANVIGQALAARLADELRIHLSPLVPGGGTRLFDLAGRRG